MGSSFGSMDKSATNDVDAAGNVVASGTAGAKTVADPNAGLSDDQMRNRQLLKAGLKGISSGASAASAQPAQRSGGGGQDYSGPPGPVTPDYTGGDGSDYMNYLRQRAFMGGGGGY